MNNPILLILIFFQLLVAGVYFVKGASLLGGLFIVYAVGNIITLFLKIQ